MTGIRCICHLLHLAVKDAFSQCANHLKNLFKKIGAAAMKYRHSSKVAEQVERAIKLRLRTANSTRWTGQVEFLERIEKMPINIWNSIFPSSAVTVDDYNCLMGICELLSKVKKYIVILEGERYCTAQAVYPTAIQLSVVLEEILVCQQAYTFKRALLNSLKRRMCILLGSNVHLYKVAMFLDPYLKDSLCSGEEKASLFEEIYAMARRYLFS